MSDIAKKKDFMFRMLGTVDNADFGKEIAACSKIFAKYPNHSDFLEAVSPPPFPLNSLWWFIGKKGSAWLEKKKKEFYHSVEHRHESKEGEKSGEDIEANRKSLMEFLNDG